MYHNVFGGNYIEICQRDPCLIGQNRNLLLVACIFLYNFYTDLKFNTVWMRFWCMVTSLARICWCMIASLEQNMSKYATGICACRVLQWTCRLLAIHSTIPIRMRECVPSMFDCVVRECRKTPQEPMLVGPKRNNFYMDFRFITPKFVLNVWLHRWREAVGISKCDRRL